MEDILLFLCAMTVIVLFVPLFFLIEFIIDLIECELYVREKIANQHFSSWKSKRYQKKLHRIRWMKKNIHSGVTRAKLVMLRH